ncbi:4'-phosphopantetheinyl transferase family protein [Sphingomonas sanguinis]|uniref:4'-phosphopantetheinyl transferase family protein n=1 Tax=Sphingomonas sanguinis TaxID=33051 RepID=UPI00187CB40D|nr:4'-phosphopantetheinyl transferase superfamily protein [Sphingomonas sanguinis]
MKASPEDYFDTGIETTSRRRSLIGAVVPEKVAYQECPPPPDCLELHPDEERDLARSRTSAKRRQEFALGRWCARQAMVRLGRGHEPLLTGRSRAPIWPQGLIGSITHCEDYCAAAVATTNDLVAIGIDAERWGDVPCDIGAHIATPGECSLSNLCPSDTRNLAILFSAKESLFKALNPLIGLFFDFQSVTLQVSTSSREFSIASTTLPEIVPYQHSLVGRFVITDQLVITSASISAT